MAKSRGGPVVNQYEFKCGRVRASSSNFAAVSHACRACHPSRVALSETEVIVEDLEELGINEGEVSDENNTHYMATKIGSLVSRVLTSSQTSPP